MTLWPFLCGMLVLSALVLLLPLLRRHPETEDADLKEMAHFKAQLAELEREQKSGLVSEADATATRREIERRALALAKSGKGTSMAAGSETGRLIAVGLTMGWVVLGSTILYLETGRPDLVAAPQPAPVTLPAPVAALPPVNAAPPTPITDLIAPPSAGLAMTPIPSQQEQPLADVGTMIARLAARLEENPNDIDGWRMLGWSHFRTQNYPDAVAAYARAVALAPRDAELLAAYGEALIVSNSGIVSGAALEAITQSLASDPANPRARYYQGMHLDQSGRTGDAIALWLDLLKSTPTTADFRPDLIDRIRTRAAAAGIDISQQLPDRQTAPVREARGPTQADIDASRDMSSEDRTAMIRGMVEGLAARLEDNPEDPEGWAQLVRSHVVLNDRAAANAALAKAREVFQGRPEELTYLAQIAGSLGLQ